MSRSVSERAISAAFLATVGALAALGCESIVGIEDRTYVPVSGDGGTLAPSPACTKYCADALRNCTGEFAVYSSEDLCLAVCAKLSPGSASNPTGNTVACRANQASLAGRTGEPDSHCPAASPGGGGVCGENCESYCALLAEFCPGEVVTNCEEKCAVLPDDGTFDVVKHHDGDYMQCRLVHVSSAAIAPESHCWHSTVTPGVASPCGDPAGTTPKCADYCRLIDTACQDDRAVYESQAQCLAACAVLDVGDSADRTEDTVGCRRYHSYSALEAPETHCPHAGAGGDGHCGKSNCPGYCRLLEGACPAEFASQFGTRAACETACAGIPGAAADSGYSVAMGAAGGDTLQCRILHAARAFADDAACASAVGGGQCL